MRGAAFLLAAALGLLAGCTTPDGVRFGRHSNCPEEIVEILTVRPNELGPWSETDTLECALSWLQDTDDPTLRRSALGSRLSLHLAERTPEADKLRISPRRASVSPKRPSRSAPMKTARCITTWRRTSNS